MLRARDIMEANVVVVRPDTPIYEAVELMIKHNISGMPVVDEKNWLVGVVSEKDAIVVYYRDRDYEKSTVSEFMTQPVVFFDENEPVLNVADFLSKNIFRRAPVIRNGELVGIISIQNVLAASLRERRH